jgi:hypothetical protein
MALDVIVASGAATEGMMRFNEGAMAPLRKRLGRQRRRERRAKRLSNMGVSPI